MRNYIYLINIFLILFILTFSKETLPQAGQLDTTFGQGGIVTTKFNFGGFNSASFSTAVQSDGKILAAGASSDQNGNLLTLVRYNLNGTLDNTFGTNGIIVGNTQYGIAKSVAIQSDGKIVAAGCYYNGSDNDFSLVRYKSNGAVDNSFGKNGIVNTKIGTAGDCANSLVIQNDGELIVGGFSYNGSDNDFTLARYNTNGDLDTTFGTDGIVITKIGNLDDYITSLAIQSNGEIVAAGYTYNGNDYDFALARYFPNGALDNSFGNKNGIVITQIGMSSEAAFSVAIQSDRKIVAAGYSNNGNDSDFALVRYNPSGSLDNTFGVNGIVTTQIGASDDGAYSLKIQSDGKIITAGYYYDGLHNDFTLVRYDSNGTLDNSFGSNGIQTTQVRISDSYANSMLIQSNGEYVVSGYSNDGSELNFALARYNTNGDLDDSFGTSGIVITQNGTSLDHVNSVAIQGDGKIVAAGDSFNGMGTLFALARYNVNGTLDNSFGSNGLVTTTIGISHPHDVVNSVAIQSDGKIVAFGSSYHNVQDVEFALARYNPNGGLDNTFGTNGIVTNAAGVQYVDASSVLIQGDEKILTTGTSYHGANTDFILIRYNKNGTLDNTFGANGMVTTRITGTDAYAKSAVIQADKKIVVAGYTYSNTYFTLIRYNENGTLDDSFGISGMVITPEGDANSVAIQGDGKIVAAGSYYDGLYYDFALARYNKNGDLDSSFGADGIITTQVGANNSNANSIAIQNDGNIIVAGSSNNGSNINFTLVRYSINGTLDTTFGTNGKITTQVGSSDDFANFVTIQNDEKIIVAGYSYNNYNYSVFTLARYNSGPTTGIKEENQNAKPITFALEQNYPNPFNPTTKIKYLQSNASYVSLKIYDILGSKVATLVNEEKSAGSYEVNLNGSNLSSGIYFYKIQAGNFVQTKKMILLK